MREWIDRLEERTKQFAIDVVCLCDELGELPALRHVGWQLNDAAGSVASNHRAMRRARSDREFAAKLQVVNEEIDEAQLWLEIADAVIEKQRQRARRVPGPNCLVALKASLVEAGELRSIFASARRTFRDRTA